MNPNGYNQAPPGSGGYYGQNPTYTNGQQYVGGVQPQYSDAGYSSNPPPQQPYQQAYTPQYGYTDGIPTGAVVGQGRMGGELGQPYGGGYHPNSAYGGGGPQPQATDNISGDPHYNDANYTNGIPLYGNNGVEAAAAGPNPTAPAKFVKQGCKDVWAAVLFILLTLAVIIWGIYNYATYFDWSLGNGNSDGLTVGDVLLPGSSNDGDIDAKLLALWAAIGVGAGVVSGLLSLVIFNCFPKGSIILANILMIGICIGFAIWAWISGTWVAAIILTVCAALRALFFWIGRWLIPFSAALLKESTSIIKSYPMLTINNLIWVILMCGWGLLVMGCVYPSIRKTWYDEDPNAGVLFGAYLFAVFASYWTTQVVYNICHVVTSGVTATWYFFGRNNMPSNPTLHSMKRALTTSFGSICFGSLLVAIVRFIRALVYMLASSSGNNNCCVMLCFCIVNCILGCIEYLLEMFNHFAFVFVAMYGCGYIDAARLTTKHIKQSVFVPLFANALVSSTLYIFSLSFGVIMGVIAYFASGGTVDNNQWQSYVVAALSAVCLVVTMGLFFNNVDSCVTAFQVCIAEEPNVLPLTNPDFAAKLGGQLNVARERSAKSQEAAQSAS